MTALGKTYMSFIDPLHFFGGGGSDKAKKPTISTPTTGDPDQTPGQNTTNPNLINAASNSMLTGSNTTRSKLLS